MKPIPYGRQHITEEDIAAVVSALKSDYLTQGPQIEHFEKAFATYVGADYAVAVSNGTTALHIAVLALGLDEGDKVITTPITFAASANCVRYAGGEVAFVDIDPDTYLLDIDKVKKLLEASPKGTFKGIIPVDFAGRSVNLQAFRKLADEYNLWILEDACHAPGGYFEDEAGTPQSCGNGKWADLSVFSFHPVKHIACGEGGMITTNDERLYKKLLNLRTHGITRNMADFQNTPEFAAGQEVEGNVYPGWYMEMQELGYNYRFTDFQAALGSSQLKRADDGLKRRRELAANYYNAFSFQKGIKGQSGVVAGHAYHLYVIECDRRLDLYNHLRKHQIFAQVHYIPCHLMPYYRGQGWKEGSLPLAEQYYTRCLSLPMYPTLTNEEQQFVIDKVSEFLNGIEK